MWTTTGALASGRWLRDRQLDPKGDRHWYVEITIIAPAAIERTSIELNLYPEEWGYVFRYGRRLSSIRVTDVPFVHGKDDLQLLAVTPPLDRIKDLITLVEHQRGFVFQRAEASVRSNLAGATSIIRAWLAS